jgi:hypothetical protein
MKSQLILLVAYVFFVASCGLQAKTNPGEPASSRFPAGGAACCGQGPLNTLTNAEKAQGWILMFDGKSSKGWRGYNKQNFPEAWKVDNGTLHLAGSGRGEAGAANGGDIIYDKKFSNFDLKMEWKISEGGNSGIFYLAQEVPGWEIYRTAPEMQVLDNDRHPDALLGKDGNRKAGSLYDLIPAKPQNAKPAGQWNSVEIICYQGTVVHKMNGETVLEYHLWTPEWNELVKNSKFPALNPKWADVAKEGFIGLQDHGNDVWYRNIKIRPL